MNSDITHNLLEVIISQSDLAIHVVDRDGVTTIYNNAAEAMDGLSRQDVLHRHILQVFPSLNRDTSTLLRVLASGQPIYNQQQTYTNLHGKSIATVNTTLPITGQDGERVGAVEMARDVSTIKALSQQVINLSQRLQKHSSEANDPSFYSFDQIVGRDAQLLAVVDKARKAARTSSPVLISGETGTGKEMIAQSIHGFSPRASHPFVAQNCAALPESLLEGLLFGSVRGSFTGAMDRPGLLELAHQGTLLLDEIGSLPPALQAKLLRVLEHEEVRRLGDTRVRKISFRLVAATAAEPRECLRPDLYYRLNVVSLHMPPLRQRIRDIPMLCAHFLSRQNREMGNSITGISHGAMDILQSYHWPGNVRELANLLESIGNYRESGNIVATDLPEHLRAGREEFSLRNELQQLERKHILAAMEAAGNNISRAAQLLKLPRQTLQRKLKALGWHTNCTE